MSELVLDAKHAILGRLSAYAAKQVLKGHSVVVINCGDALITGNSDDIIKTYLTMRQKGGSAMNGPNFPSNPSRILKRTIRGMLPYKQGRGLAAFKRVRCFDHLPKQMPAAKPQMFVTKTHAKTMTLREVCQQL